MSTGRSRYSKTRWNSASELTTWTPVLSRPISGRNSWPWSAVNAIRVPIVMVPRVMGSPALR